MPDPLTSSQHAAFARALRQVVTTGARVLDLGGDFAHRAVVACRLGAAGVWSVQPDSSVSVVREIARVNGYAERIHVMDRSRLDAAVADQPFDLVLGHVPFCAPILTRDLLADRRRWVSSSARVMPQHEALRIAVVHAPAEHARHTSVWRETGLPWNLEAAARRTRQQWSRCHLSADALATVPLVWADIDCQHADVPSIKGTVELTATAPAVAHGLVVWSTLTLVEGVDIDFAPATSDVTEPHAFFPWPEPVALRAHDRIVVTIRADGLDRAETWTWTTRVMTADSGGQPSVQFSQSTFFAESESPSVLAKSDAAYVPVLTTRGEIDRAILTLLHGGLTIDQAARDVARYFPEGGLHQARGRVATLANHYGHPRFDV